jgi:hemolysin III
MYHGERFNSISHFVGLLLAVAASSVLITLVSLTGDPWKIVSSSIFSGAMIFLYGFSTLYHSIRGPSKFFFQKLDYIAIYIMIAATYTPFTLVSLRQEMGWLIFSIIWGLAIFGIVLEIVRKPSPQRKLSLTIYLAMGWMVLSVAKTLFRSLDSLSLIFLVLGGLFYTFGVIFFVNDTKWKHAHGIWHLFVLAGSTCHFSCILNEMLPSKICGPGL